MQLQGIHAASGLVLGCFLILEEPFIPDWTEQSIENDQIRAEQARLQVALSTAASQLAELSQRASRAGQPVQAELMAAHAMMLSDHNLTARFLSTIATEHRPAAGAVQKVIEDQATVFDRLEDASMRERAQDVRDIGRRLIRCLLGVAENDWRLLSEPSILVAHEITPSMLVAADRGNLLGIVAETGGETSHTAILAQSLGVPAVLGCLDAVAVAKAQPPGTRLLVDGDAGVIRFLPLETSETMDPALVAYETHAAHRSAVLAELEAFKNLPTLTRDGYPVQLMANILGLDDLINVRSVGADGVGLFRTDRLFLARTAPPDEEEQYQAYKKTAEALEGKPLAIRTLDLGGDKTPSYLDIGRETNPALGFRGLRISLERDDLFMPQLRAILRASAYGDVRILLPMVGSLTELRQAKAKLDQAREQLRLRGESFAEALKVGVLIEVPAAALMAEQLIQEADFLSIGSNDLAQYTLAVDRQNERISALNTPFHPALLRLYKNVIDAAQSVGKGPLTSLCGEMAADPRAILLLLGLGLRVFSVDPAKLLLVRRHLASMDLNDARVVAKQALTLDSADAVEHCLAQALPFALNTDLF